MLELRARHPGAARGRFCLRLVFQPDLRTIEAFFLRLMKLTKVRNNIQLDCGPVMIATWQQVICGHIIKTVTNMMYNLASMFIAVARDIYEHYNLSKALTDAYAIIIGLMGRTAA
jgi:hypothetical protein